MFQVHNEGNQSNDGRQSNHGKRNGASSVGVLAAGGRYDPLIAHFCKPGTSLTQTLPGVVGVSIAFDKV